MPATTKNTTAPTPGKKPIQLYSLGTPNEQKIGIALEERGLEYNAHIIDIRKGTQFGKSRTRKWKSRMIILLPFVWFL
jgi:hypothetical protein